MQWNLKIVFRERVKIQNWKYIPTPASFNSTCDPNTLATPGKYHDFLQFWIIDLPKATKECKFKPASQANLVNHHPFLKRKYFYMDRVIWVVLEQPNSFRSKGEDAYSASEKMIMMASKYAGIHPGLGASQYFILIYTERRNNWKLPYIKGSNSTHLHQDSRPTDFGYNSRLVFGKPHFCHYFTALPRRCQNNRGTRTLCCWNHMVSL